MKKMIDTKDVKVNLELGKGSTLLYQFVRGSHSHGTATETSDIDTMSVYVAPLELLMSFNKPEDFYVHDEKNDNVAYEIGRFLELLLKSNPTMLESLFVSDDCIIYKHPIMDKIISMRDQFLSKDALISFSSYALEQVRKARGYNKLCAYPEDMERKQPLEFCFTFKNQGTTPITSWLEERGLKQIYCGLNHLPNMNQMFGLFYDWGQHIHMEWKNEGEFLDYYHAYLTGMKSPFIDCLIKYGLNEYPNIKIGEIYNTIKPKGYHGIQKIDGTSNDVHLDSIKKGDVPLCWMHYNKDGYQSHCKLYKNWSDWKKMRNEVRYKSNFGRGYDAKNMSEVIRLLRMACELAEGKGFNVDRRITGDREYLLDIKKHKYTYEELMEVGNQLDERLTKAMKTCNLPQHVDEKMVNQLLLDIRKELYSIK